MRQRMQSDLVIMDGELVADEDRATGDFKLTYLAYDLIEASTPTARALPHTPSNVVDLSFRRATSRAVVQASGCRDLPSTTGDLCEARGESRLRL